jgi:RNA recognition motif-containing protein
MKLYIGNISYKVSEKEIREHFKSVGEINTAKIIIDRDNGKSRGYAFVEMFNKKSAKKAINELNGTKILGRNIIVSIAK